MNKNKIFLWSLYDFANSIVFINFLIYFSQWLVIDGGLSDFWYNATFAIATLLLFLSAPILAAYTDKHGGRKYFLNIATIGTALSYGFAAVFAIIGSNILVITFFFLLSQYFYQLCFVFYNPLINEIADIQHRARTSGIGQFSNALGQIVGLAIMLPLAGTRLGPLLPSVCIFIVLALPMMIYYKENSPFNGEKMVSRIKTEVVIYKEKLVTFFAISLSTPLLLSFFFYNDALVTVSNNYSIYLQRVFNVPDSTKSLLLMIIVLMNALGAIFSGWVGDKIGIFKTLIISLIGWLIALPIMAFAPSLMVYGIATIFLGLLIGSMWTTSRAYISTLLSNDNMGFGFSFYTLLERFATFVGPLTWGAVISLLGTDIKSYRIAMLSMAVFVLIGLLILSFWKRQPKN